jgi:hypothetical protein
LALTVVLVREGGSEPLAPRPVSTLGGRWRCVSRLPPPPARPPRARRMHGGVTTVGVAVRGTTNAEKLKKREEK